MKKKYVSRSNARRGSLVSYERVFSVMASVSGAIYNARQIATLLIKKYPAVFARVDLSEVQKSVSAMFSPSTSKCKVKINGTDMEFGSLIQRLPNAGLGRLMGYRYIGPKISTLGYCGYEAEYPEHRKTSKSVNSKVKSTTKPVNTPSSQNDVLVRVDGDVIYISNIKGRSVVIEAA